VHNFCWYRFSLPKDGKFILFLMEIKLSTSCCHKRKNSHSLYDETCFRKNLAWKGYKVYFTLNQLLHIQVWLGPFWQILIKLWCNLLGLSAVSGVHIEPTFQRPSWSSSSGSDPEGFWNVGSVQTTDMADSPRRLHQIQLLQKLKNLYQLLWGGYAPQHSIKLLYEYYHL